MGLLDRAKAAATDLAAKADTALSGAGASLAGTANPESLLRDLGVLTYLESTGREASPEERHRVMTELLEAENSADIFNILSTLPSKMDDVDALLEAMENVAGTVTDVIIDDNRRRHISILLSERGSWRPNLDRNLHGSSSRILKRTIKRSKSVVDILLFGEPTSTVVKEENYR